MKPAAAVSSVPAVGCVACSRAAITVSAISSTRTPPVRLSAVAISGSAVARISAIGLRAVTSSAVARVSTIGLRAVTGSPIARIPTIGLRAAASAVAASRVSVTGIIAASHASIRSRSIGARRSIVASIAGIVSASHASIRSRGVAARRGRSRRVGSRRRPGRVRPWSRSRHAARRTRSVAARGRSGRGTGRGTVAEVSIVDVGEACACGNRGHRQRENESESIDFHGVFSFFLRALFRSHSGTRHRRKPGIKKIRLFFAALRRPGLRHGLLIGRRSPRLGRCELPVKPRARHGPLALHSGRRNAHRFRCFLHR